MHYLLNKIIFSLMHYIGTKSYLPMSISGLLGFIYQFFWPYIKISVSLLLQLYSKPSYPETYIPSSFSSLKLIMRLAF